MSTKLIKYGLIGFAVLFIAIGSNYLYSEIEKLKKYCYKFKDVIIRKASLQKSIIELVMEFTNTSKLDAEVYGYAVSITINDKDVGKIISDKKINIGATKKFYLPIKVEFDPRKILNVENFWNALQSVEDKSAFLIKFSGNITVGVLGGAIKNNIIVDNTYTLAQIVRMGEQPSNQSEVCN